MRVQDAYKMWLGVPDTRAAKSRTLAGLLRALWRWGKVPRWRCPIVVPFVERPAAHGADNGCAVIEILDAKGVVIDEGVLRPQILTGARRTRAESVSVARENARGDEGRRGGERSRERP